MCFHDHGLATSAVDLNQLAGLDALMDTVAADPTELERALAALLGTQGSGLTEDVTIPLGGWLLQFSPAYAQEVAEAPVPPPTNDAQAGAIVCVDEPTPDPVEPASPLRSPRFAGEPILEQCLAGTHRMLTPEGGQGRARPGVQGVCPAAHHRAARPGSALPRPPRA